MLQTQQDGVVTAGTENNWMCLKSEKIPCARVGHTCTYVPSNQPNDSGRMYLIGGASHDCVCSDVHVLDLTSLTWTSLQSIGFVARYEHTAFYTASHPTKIFVFAGANESGNSVPLQIYEIGEQKWYTAKTEGPSPPIRTFHNGATSSDWLVVFGGGDLGTNPVQDDKVYMFNAANNKWKILETKGLAPELRLGHAMLIIRNVLYLHGGMVGTSLFDDLFTLNLESGVWSNPTTNGDVPSARAGHVMFLNPDSESAIYIFGGMTVNGASNELFKLNIETMDWSEVSTSLISAPCKRFDLACVSVKLKDNRNNKNTDNNNLNNKNINNNGANIKCCVFFHGGMNERGLMYDDIFCLTI